MKVQPRKIKNDDRIKYLDALYTAMGCLKSRDEIKNFLRDLLTESERMMLGRRIIIARRLLEDKTYDEIKKEIGVGVDTIMRVHRWLGGDEGGYEKTVKELNKVLNSRKKLYDSKIYEPGSFGWLKRRYPLHFFLFNLFDELNKK